MTGVLNRLDQDQTGMVCKVPEIGIPRYQGNLMIETGLRDQSIGEPGLAVF